MIARGGARGANLPAFLSAAALALTAAAPLAAMPADQARVDAAALTACVADAGGGAAAMACVGSAQADCIAHVKDAYRDVGEVHPEMPCLAAERAYWDARLTERYDRLMRIEEGRGPERARALREAERAWIGFRDALCGYDKVTNGHGTGGETAEPACLLRETARQSLLLDGYLADRS